MTLISRPFTKAKWRVRGIGVADRGKDIDARTPLLDFFLLGHTKTLFLIDDEKAQVLEVDIGLNQAMGADNNVKIPFCKLIQCILLLLTAAGSDSAFQFLHQRHPCGFER